MTPYETAATWHLNHCPAIPFRDILEAHLFCGYVISGPDRFILGRRVCRAWPEERLEDPWETDADGDAWFVWLWAGTVEDWRAVLPYPLPWLMWRRGERMRCFPLREIARAREMLMIGGHGQSQDTETTASSRTGTDSAHDGCGSRG